VTRPALPLDGVRVVDFTRILSGPYCSLLLSDMGAEVIKVERSDRGDDTRAWGPPFLDHAGTTSTYFAALNRGKKSVALDFRASATPEVLLQLCAQADVVIENFRPGVRESLGLDWPALRSLNPALVLCSISGFGQTGPYADLPGTEIVVEAMSGLMEITGPIDGGPVRFGIAMVDIATGLTAATKIVASLMLARQSGQGAYLDCSLYATAMAALGTSVASYSATREEPRRWGSHHPSIVPYGGFPTADGHLITGVINNGMWRPFCEALELDDLADDELYLTNASRVERRDDLQGRIAATCQTKPTAYWLERLRERGLLAAPVRTVGAAVDDPATNELGLLVPLDGFPGVYSTRLDGDFRSAEPEHVPRLGQHTEEILAGLSGLSADVISSVIGAIEEASAH
jgi:crotonobetainyl-CoA:carnitine CoA-transferase CaiB-like acyl-CoA transferase